MPQKALFNKVRKSQGKSLAANRHGKVVKHKKGVASCVKELLGNCLINCLPSFLRSGRRNFDVGTCPTGNFVLQPKKESAKKFLEEGKVSCIT